VEFDPKMDKAIIDALRDLQTAFESKTDSEVLDYLLEKTDPTGESSKLKREPVWFNDLITALARLYETAYQNGINDTKNLK